MISWSVIPFPLMPLISPTGSSLCSSFFFLPNINAPKYNYNRGFINVYEQRCLYFRHLKMSVSTSLQRTKFSETSKTFGFCTFVMSTALCFILCLNTEVFNTVAHSAGVLFLFRCNSDDRLLDGALLRILLHRVEQVHHPFHFLYVAFPRELDYLPVYLLHVIPKPRELVIEAFQRRLHFRNLRAGLFRPVEACGFKRIHAVFYHVEALLQAPDAPRILAVLPYELMYYYIVLRFFPNHGYNLYFPLFIIGKR